MLAEVLLSPYNGRFVLIFKHSLNIDFLTVSPLGKIITPFKWS